MPIQGGGVQLQKSGVFFVKELNAQKARLKLLIALNAGLTGAGFERLYGRLSLFSRKQNQESSRFPDFFYLRFRVERRSVKP